MSDQLPRKHVSSESLDVTIAVSPSVIELQAGRLEASFV
jgi:hypothetical protein